MSSNTVTIRASSTRTLPPRTPDGFPFAHPRYRWYVLFAATGMPLAIAAGVLLFALGSLGQGSAAWAQYLACMRSPAGLGITLVSFVGVLYFAVRWMWVGRKIPGVRLGPIPAPPMEAVLVLQFAGLFSLFVVIVALLSGALV